MQGTAWKPLIASPQTEKVGLGAAYNEFARCKFCREISLPLLKIGNTQVVGAKGVSVSTER